MPLHFEVFVVRKAVQPAPRLRNNSPWGDVSGPKKTRLSYAFLLSKNRSCSHLLCAFQWSLKRNLNRVVLSCLFCERDLWPSSQAQRNNHLSSWLNIPFSLNQLGSLEKVSPTPPKAIIFHIFWAISCWILIGSVQWQTCAPRAACAFQLPRSYSSVYHHSLVIPWDWNPCILYTSWCILNPIQFISQSFSYKFSTHKHLQPMFSHIPDQGTFDWSRSVASMIQTPLSPGFQDCIISLPRTTKNPSSALSACSLALCSSKVLEALGPNPQRTSEMKPNQKVLKVFFHSWWDS